jgi:preprotein translocase subunit SecD
MRRFRRPRYPAEGRDRAHARGHGKLAALSTRSLGRKLAIVLEGQVVTAPIVEGPIPDGRVLVTLADTGDPSRLLEEAKSLAAVLSMGSLLAPVVFVREEPVAAEW